MSYVELSGVGDEVSGEKIVYELNAQGLVCTRMNKYMEGGINVIRFDLDDGDAAAYRKAQTKANMIIKLNEAFERAGVYIYCSSTFTPGKGKRVVIDLDVELSFFGPANSDNVDVDVNPELSVVSWQLTAPVVINEPPPSSLPRGSSEWAEQFLAGSGGWR